MASSQKNYNFSSVVLYDQAFDTKDDIIVSFVRSNEESEHLGFIKLEGDSFDSRLLDLETELEDKLSLNIPNVFDNLCIFLYDSRMPALTGTSRSHGVSSFETQGIPGISWLSAGQTWYLAPSAYQAVYTSDAYHDNFSSDYYISGDGQRLIYPGVNRSDGPYGWAFQSIGDVEGSESGPTLISTVSATSGLQPWEVTEYFVPTNSIGPLPAGHTGNRTFGNSLSTYFTNPDTTINVQFSGFKSFGHQEDGRISLAVDSARDLQSPGCNLVNSNKRGVDVALASNFGISLSGLLAMTVIDNNGAFGLSGSQRFFYTGGTEFLSAGNFAVRTNTYSGNDLPPVGTDLTFDFKGSVIPASYPTVEDDWKLHRVGFRRHLQEIVLYQSEDGVYTPDHIFETGFNINTLPPSVKIGFSYSGEMPMEIRNIAVNGTVVE